MKFINYTSVNRIIGKLNRDLGLEDINESDIIEWIGEALEAIKANNSYEEQVAFIEVKDHKAELPKGLHAIIQIARNNCIDKYNLLSCKDSLCPKEVVNVIAESSDCGCNKEEPVSNCQKCSIKEGVCLDCEGRPINDHQIAYYRPYFDLQYEYYNWTNNNYYRQCFSPVRLTNHSFFGSLVCKENNDQLYHACKDEYNISGGALHLSFKEGQIAVSFLKQKLDEEGYPMIPDNISFVTAITKYILYRISEKRFYNNEQGSESRLVKSEKDWHWYCKQAINESKSLTIDDYQDLIEQRNYLIPRLNKYYGFFGNLNTPESKKFNDPARRNNHYRLGRF